MRTYLPFMRMIFPYFICTQMKKIPDAQRPSKPSGTQGGRPPKADAIDLGNGYGFESVQTGDLSSFFARPRTARYIFIMLSRPLENHLCMLLHCAHVRAHACLWTETSFLSCRTNTATSGAQEVASTASLGLEDRVPHIMITYAKFSQTCES
jgi:hypothetical protein